MEQVKELFEYLPLYTFKVGNYEVGITMSLVVQWVIVLLVAIICILLTRNLKKIPSKRQSVLEMLVEFARNQVNENMGEDFMTLAPYIGSVAIYLLCMNMTGLFGFDPPTQDFSVALGMGFSTFIVIQGYTIKKVGFGHYLTAYAKPMALLLPINILERFTLPVSLSLRLFGNMIAAGVVMKLVYVACAGLKPFFGQLLLPIPLHFYFDLFDGTVQMIIFTMLTMVNLKVISQHGQHEE